MRRAPLTGLALGLALALALPAGSPAGAQEGATAAAARQKAGTRALRFMTHTDMMRPVLYLVDIDTDKLITVDLSKDPKYPGGMPLHTVVLPDGRKAYLSVMSSDKDPLTILALRVGEIGWDAGMADVEITKVMRVEEPGSKPSMLVPTQTDPSQPVTKDWQPTNHQLHGPTIHPSGRWVYFTQWTDNKIRVIDVAKDTLAATDPVQLGTLTRQIHGAFFNPSGRLALTTGYYYDINHLVLWQADKRTGGLKLAKVIPLVVSEKEKQYAAFSHFVAWLDNRYAVTSTQQTGPTSLTPSGFKVVGPSVWLLDTQAGTAKMVIGPAGRPEDPGIYKPASDVLVVGKKLYVAEEDTMDEEINNEGYLSVWDLSNPAAPKFLKRLKPGRELPPQFGVGHELYRSTDDHYVYTQDWHSGTLVKLDARTDEVLKVFARPEHAWQMPHGGFVPGTIR